MNIQDRWARIWPPLLAVVVVAAVGTPAAVASYRHARDVVASTGDVVMAPWLPLSVDGMLLAALVVIWVRRHRGEDAGAGPWAAFGFGMVVTVAANLAAVDLRPAWFGPATATDYVVALFPPLALAITLELVAMVAYRTRPQLATTTSDATSPATSPSPAVTTTPASAVTTSTTSAATSPEVATTSASTTSPATSADEPASATTSEPETSPVQVVAVDDEVALQKVRELLADGAGRPTVMSELGVNDYRARQLMRRVRQESGRHRASTTTNGKVHAG